MSMLLVTLMVCLAIVASVALVTRASVQRAQLAHEVAEMSLDVETMQRILDCEAKVADLAGSVREQGNALAVKGVRR